MLFAWAISAAIHFVGGILHGLYNILVASAAAQVAFQAMANFVFGGVRVLLKEIVGRHDHARGAVATL